MEFLKNELPSWVTDADLEKLNKSATEITLCDVDSLVNKGEKLEFFVKAPSDTAYAASMRFITNSKENTNDVVKMQKTLFDFCFLVGEPKLMQELESEETKARQMIAIGLLIGEAYPMPEASVKKSFRRK
jgi:hypothetical protein